MATSQNQTKNHILDALSPENRLELVVDCKQVALTFGTIICEANERIQHVYFPLDSFISLVMPIEGGTSLEVALVGNEGFYGIPLVLGVDISPLRALVQGTGNALQLDTERFHSKLENCVALRSSLNRYIYVSMRQLAQTAACNRFHVVEGRLARWLLMTRDRVHSDAFHITHEFLAQMLGVRRVGVTKAAGALQRQNLIHYSRGEIQILNLAGLKAASCGCYQADRDSYNLIMDS
jgi:CRP-like cAMP-binding protein